MKLAKNLLVAAVVAPEFVSALAVYAIWLHWPELFSFIGSRLKSDTDVWKYLNFLPIALLTACFRFAAKLRAPLEPEHNKKLYAWPDYKLLVGRINLALTIGSIAGITQFLLWMFGKQLHDGVIGVVFVGCTFILSVITAGLMLASMKIGEILVEHG